MPNNDSYKKGVVFMGENIKIKLKNLSAETEMTFDNLKKMQNRFWLF